MAKVDGTPGWFELTTQDVERAANFYERVVGWSVGPASSAEDDDYLIASTDAGQAIAGFMKPPVEASDTGWSVYFATADIAKTIEQARTAGGSILSGPGEAPGGKSFAVIADPQGVVFSLVQFADGGGNTAFKPGMSENFGHGVWVELATPDPDAAFAFYGELFGWTKAGGMPMGEMGEYAFIGTKDTEAGVDRQPMAPGAIMPSTTTNAPARWSWYIHVPDIDAAVAAAAEAGGQVLQDPMEIPGGSFSANLIDPQGFHIGLVGPRK